MKVAVVRGRGLEKRFVDGPRPVRAVVDADITVRRGELVLVLGPSGAGKTTLLSLLGCILEPTDGVLEVCGHEVAGMRPGELAAMRLRHLGFVYQGFRLVDALSAAENVELPLNLAGRRRPESRASALRLLDEVGLGDRADFLPDRLSAGERQRVGVARALALDPDLLLADEPTGNLDAASGRRVVALLREAARRRGAGVVLVSHDARLRSAADTVLRMEDGRLEDA